MTIIKVKTTDLRDGDKKVVKNLGDWTLVSVVKTKSVDYPYDVKWAAPDGSGWHTEPSKPDDLFDIRREANKD